MTKSSHNRLTRRLTVKHKRLHMVPVQKRACGCCTACCTELAVRNPAEPGMIAMNKDAGVPCEFLNDGCCSIYNTRPRGCRDYLCGYALNMLGLGAESRPDRINCIIDIGNATIKEMTDKGEVLRQVPDAVHIRPLDPDALVRLPLLMERLAKRHTCVVMHREEIVGLMVQKDEYPVGDSTKSEKMPKSDL